MTALTKMLAETERLAQRYELRLEQYRIATLSGSGSDQTAMMDMRRHERALRKLRALQAEIRRYVLEEHSAG